MAKKSRQKFKYLENKKSFQDHHFQRAFIKANKTIFLEGEGLTLKG